MKCKLRLEWVLSYSFLLLLSSAVKAEMISKCAVNGTQVEFQCSGASWWYVDYVYYEGAVDTITLEAVMDGTNITSGDFTSDVIICYSSYFEVHDAYLIVVDEQHGKVPLNVTLTPLNKTTLLVEWEDLPIYENITYEFALSIGQDYQETVEVTGSSLLLNLEDQECQLFQVNISMPGNCDDVVITGSLLIDPPYPMPEAITTIALKNKSIVLTWQQPDNIFMESVFTYNITALLVTTGHVLDQRTITLESLESPREVYNFTEVELCEEIRFTLTQAGDCREQQICTFLPIFPGPFVSEISVEVFFTENGDVGIVEITFQPPDLCEHQLGTGSYVLSFSDGNSSWSTAPERLSHTVTFSERTQFVRDRQYTATATVITSYSTVSSTQNFSTTSPKAKAILDDTTLAYEFHDDSVLHVSWDNPTNTLRDSFTYVVSVTVVSTGEMVEQPRTIAFGVHSTPHVDFQLSQYTCEQVNISIHIFNSNESISRVVTPPAYPYQFQQNTTANPLTIDGKIKELEVTFTPPQLCDFQSASYVMRFTSGNETWSRDPVDITDTSQQVKEDIETGFTLNRNYTVTITVFMEHENLTSSANFSFVQPTVTIAKLDDTTFALEFHNDSVLHVSWDNPTNTLRDPFIYVVSVTVVSTGEMVEQPRTIAFGVHSTPHLDFQLSQYACEQVNISVHIFHSNASISRVVTPPAYPYQFQQNTTAIPLIIDGRIKELEVTFTPPQLCDFQSARYVMRFTSGNETWSRDPVVITHTSQQVKEDIETGFTLNRNYTVTITVFMEHTTLTSSANFSFIQPTMAKAGSLSPELWSGVGALAVMVVVVVCAFVCGMVLFLKLRKQRTEAKYSLKDKHLPTVTNPIYETGDDVYEELPDLDSDKTANKLVSDTAFTTVAPPLPSTRYDHLPALGKITADNGTTSTALTHTPKQDPMMLNIPPSESIGAFSALSREDCYTIMSPAGTMTMMPRNRHSLPGSGSGVSAPAPDGELTLNCI